MSNTLHLYRQEQVDDLRALKDVTVQVSGTTWVTARRKYPAGATRIVGSNNPDFRVGDIVRSRI